MNFENRFRQKDWSGFRLILLGAFFFLVLIGLWSRAYYIQVVQGSKLEKKAVDQYFKQKVAYGKRGEIFDSNGNLLAKSLLVHSVFARPEKVENSVRASKILSEILDLDSETIQSKLEGKNDFVWIVRQIGDGKSKKVRDARLKGIYLIEKHRRYYPQGHLAGQLLGCVGVDNEGLEGLELSLDKHLKGEKKKFLVSKDAAGRLIAPGEAHRDLSGTDLRLTLDSAVQYTAEKVLSQTVDKYRAKSGMCLVLEVDSGDILAWANYPFFNPNNYRRSDPACRRNRVAMDLIEPGSTLKPIVVAASLQENVCNKDDEYFCENGKWRVSGRYIKDTHKYKDLSVDKIIRYSSNIGAGKIGLELGKRRLYSYLKKMGVGEKSELPLPGERAGILRYPGSWTKVDLISASFGQGLSMNSLQLAKMYNCLANKGVLKDLNLIENREYTEENGSHERIFSRDVANTVLKMLRSVVEQNGTGTNARIAGLQVGGKTGTAQKSGKNGYSDEYVASFVGLLPAMNPEYLVLSVINEPRDSHYGGVVAAPVVKDVGRELLASKEDLQRQYVKQTNKEQKESPYGKKANFRISRDNQGGETIETGQVPNVQGMELRSALEKFVQKGIVPRIHGQGKRVVKQSPSPGSEWEEAVDSKIWLSEVGQNP